MSDVSKDFACESLWAALRWEQLKPGELIDAIAARLHKHPSFRHLTISQPDLLLADAKRGLEHDVSEHEWKLVQEFKRELEFAEEDAVA